MISQFIDKYYVKVLIAKSSNRYIFQSINLFFLVILIFEYRHLAVKNDTKYNTGQPWTWKIYGASWREHNCSRNGHRDFVAGQTHSSNVYLVLLFFKSKISKWWNVKNAANDLHLIGWICFNVTSSFNYIIYQSFIA